MKKKSVIHLYGPSITHMYTTICGQNINAEYKDTVNPDEVTCKNCLRTKNFRKEPK